LVGYEFGGFVKQALEQALQHAVDTLLQDALDAGADTKKVEVKLSRPKVKEHGDYAANVAMALAGLLKKNPRQVAELLLQTVQWPEQVEKTDLERFLSKARLMAV